MPQDPGSLSSEEKRRLLKRLLSERSALQKETEADLRQGFEFPSEYFTLRERFKELERLGYGNIYFIPSDGINNNMTSIDGRPFINYASYNYIGMSGDPIVSKAAKDAVDRYGTSVSASRLTSGERPLYRKLEEELADLLGSDDCIVFVGGYITNETVIGHLLGEGDLVLYDSLIHASVQQGCKLSGAAQRPFPHNNWQALNQILKEQRHGYKQVLIVIEGVYSMDGDIPELPKFIEIKKRHRALLMIDEAHSIGVLGEHGRGIGEYYQVDPADVDLWMGTLSKAFASCGGYISGQKALLEYIRYTAPGFVYSVGMSPPNAAAALAAIRLLKEEPHRVKQLHSRAKLFIELARSQGLNTGTSKDSAVIPVVLGQSLPCVQLYKALYDRGILVLPIMYPTVPENSARLRFFLSSTHTEEQIYTTIEAISKNIPDSLKIGQQVWEHYRFVKEKSDSDSSNLKPAT